MNLNELLDRTSIYNQIKTLLTNFNKTPICEKRNIYIYGVAGVGKTTFITKLLQELNYDIITYDSEHIRTTTLIESFSNLRLSRNSILGNFTQKPKKRIIIMDDVDNIHINDKGCMNSLIKLIRPKKNKKQQLEPYNTTPIICIGNPNYDKTSRELHTVCNVFELQVPTISQMHTLIGNLFMVEDTFIISTIYNFTKADISKLFGLVYIYGNQYMDLIQDITSVFLPRTPYYDCKTKTQVLLTESIPIQQHATFLTEPERTIINKLWHENVVGVFKNSPTKTLPLYIKILKNICYADYLDRITFQKQIWQLNEMSSLIKTFKNSNILHEPIYNDLIIPKKVMVNDIRFTKILTKYSTEYNNFLFIRNVCQTLNITKRDLVGYMQQIIHLPDDEKVIDFDNELIDKQCITRLSKYIHKYLFHTEVDSVDDIKETDQTQLILLYEYE
jgi:GTPase SAR1 family protein